MLFTPPSITIIGFGAFGQLLAGLLAPHGRVSIYEQSLHASEQARAIGFPVIAHASDISAEIVILAIPVQAFGPCLQEIAPHLRPDQIVIDVCSIKEEPARLMCQNLPSHGEILACHPMFGPQSARKGLTGSQIVLCPIRGTRWRGLAAFLRRQRFDVVITSPEEHDRQAALSQGLTHLLARAMSSFGGKPRIRTRSFELMSEALALVANDAPEVFEAVTQRNQYTERLCEELISALSQLGGARADAASAQATVGCAK